MEKKTRERIVFTPSADDRLIIKDGKKYRLLKEAVEGGHIKEVIFEEYDEEELNKRIDNIAKYLVSASRIDAKIIIKDLLKQMDTKTLEAIEKQVKKEEPVTIEPGCLSLKIGRRTIEIIQ